MTTDNELTEATELPDPDTMPSKERLMEIIEIRKQQMNADDLPPALLRRGLELVRAERRERTGRKTRKTKASSSSQSKLKLEPFDDSDF